MRAIFPPSPGCRQSPATIARQPTVCVVVFGLPPTLVTIHAHFCPPSTPSTICWITLPRPVLPAVLAFPSRLPLPLSSSHVSHTILLLPWPTRSLRVSLVLCLEGLSTYLEKHHHIPTTAYALHTNSDLITDPHRPRYTSEITLAA